jgi:F-type H+-transporting ATPase subunit delta
MKITKEIRRGAPEHLRERNTNGQLDRGKIAALIDSLAEKRPRHYVDILHSYKRLIRLEEEKRRARIESTSQVSPEVSSRITDKLRTRYGDGLTTEFIVDPSLLGGMRIRVGSDVWDGSVRNRLERLKQQL